MSAITLAEARDKIAKMGDKAPHKCGGDNCVACTVSRVLAILSRVGEAAPPEPHKEQSETIAALRQDIISMMSAHLIAWPKDEALVRCAAILDCYTAALSRSLAGGER